MKAFYQNTHEPSPHLKPEIQAYQHALSVWETFHAQSKCPALDEEFLTRRAASDNSVDRVLRLLPQGERIPVAFGLFVRFGRNWKPVRQSVFLGEFLPNPSTVERRLLEAAAKGAVKRPRKIPVTVEEFPSRIWKRAQASQCPQRLVTAGWLASIAMLSLHEQHEEDTDQEDPMTFRIPSGDLPDVIDLTALSPVRFLDLKNRVIDRVMDETLAGRFEIFTKEMPAIKAWVLVDTDDRGAGIEKLSAEARTTMESYLITGSLRDHHHTRRLGRLMFRFGLRRLASQCAKVLGYSPWAIGWQFQSISGNTHSRIRKIILRPDSDADAWMTEPALACSAMSIPLWLMDGVARVSSLVALFNKAAECPWIFPRLNHIYQWHLALVGKHEELRQIEQLAPEFAVGLSENPTPCTP
jgi:hypothetical protein